ncbi:MAG: sulfurtransferase [Chloroflexota bacterium]
MSRPLISAQELARRIEEPDVRVVDVRWVLGQPGAGRRAYDAGHLPGAIFLDLDGDLALPPGPGRAGRHPLPPPAEFAARLARAGIRSDDLVVAYDDVGGWIAARLWWMLDDLGHRGGAAVLDGGMQAWVAAGGALSVDVPAPPAEQGGLAEAGKSAAPAVPLELADRWTKVVDRDALRERLGKVVLLDSRGAPRYRGETEPIDAYPGHIPTAINAPTDGNLLEPSGAFLSAPELRARFEGLAAEAVAAGAAEAGAAVVTSCGSGVSACHASLAMRIAGLPDPILYVGSYSDWSAAGEPIVVGSEPGSVPESLPGSVSTAG